MKTSSLSDLIYEVRYEGPNKEYSDVIFYCKSLTVFQNHSALCIIEDTPHLAVGRSLWINIAYECIVDWYGFEDEEGNLIKYDRNLLDHIDGEVLVYVGRIIYESISNLTEKEEEMLKGLVRFTSFLTDEDNEKRNRELFDCDYCVKNRLINYRNCGRPDKDKLMAKHNVQANRDVPSPRSKYSASKRTKRFQNEDQLDKSKMADAQSDGDKVITLKGFKFKECPVSWIDNKTRNIVSILNYCIRTNRPYMPGSVSEQPNKIQKMLEVVQYEQNKIEYEDFKKKSK